MKFKIKGIVGHSPILVDPHGKHGTFHAGNKVAARENMSEESHQKRVKALFKGWGVRARLIQGEKFMSVKKQQKLATRKRVKLSQTVAREAREIQELARKNAQAAMERMAEIATSSYNEAAAIAATQVILERAYGKANQTTINANLDANGKAAEISGKELDARVEQALKRFNDLAGGEAEAPKSPDKPADVRQPDRDPDSSTKH